MAIKPAELSEFDPYQMDGPYDVYSIGNRANPPVLLMHEIPSLSNEVLGLAKKISTEGYFVVVPSLVGRPGHEGWFDLAESIIHICISKEFRALAKEESGDIVDWLREICRQLYVQHSQQDDKARGVGVIGLCATGNFALTLMMDANARVVAPIMSEPSLPLSVGNARKSALNMSISDLAAVKARLENEDLTVLGLRFKTDWKCPNARFVRLRAELGDRFEGVEIPPGPEIREAAHSVLTKDFIDKAGHPTQAAYNKVLALLNLRLK